MYKYLVLIMLTLMPVDVLAGTIKIVLFGDSLIAGPYIPEDENISATLQKYMDYYKVDADVINAGVNGETTAGGLARVDYILKMQPDLVVLALGANDMLRQQDPKTAFENLDKILQRLIAGGKTRVLLAGMYARPNYTKVYQESFNSMYPTLAKHYGVELFPFLLQDVAMVPDMNLDDGMHPNAKGAAKIAQNMVPYIFKVLGYYDQVK